MIAAAPTTMGVGMGRREGGRGLGSVRLTALLAIVCAMMGADVARVIARMPEDATFRGTRARTGEQPGPGPKGEPAELWQVVLDEPVLSSPIVAGGAAYVKAWDDRLHALDVETGRELWSFETGGLDTAAAVVDGVVYAGGANAEETAGALDAPDAETGQEIWRHETAYALSDSSPVVAGGVVYIGGGNGEETGGALYAVDAASGSERWVFDA